MDDVEDDARYPLNPHHRQNSTPRPKLPIHPQLDRRFSDQDDDDSNSDDIKSVDQRPPPHQQQQQSPIDYMEEDDGGEADDDDDQDDDSSLESRGKRRKLDNFEFVPRKPAAAVVTTASPSLKPLGVKNSPPDWSEDSTFVLLEAWGERYVKNGRKSLRFDEWSDVALKVNQRSRTARSDSQCRNRLDTLKKKYKKEKVRMAENTKFKSDWVYFEKMDALMALPSPPEQAVVPAKKRSPVRLACGVDAGEYVFANSTVHLNRANAMDEMRDSPGDTGTDDDDVNEEDDESDGLPPTMSEKKKKKKGRGVSQAYSPSSFRILADSIQKFGEVYERIESSKRQQVLELERMRKDFHKDLEAQKRQILERAQAEIARIRQEEGEEEEDERLTGDDDGHDCEEDDINGSAGNLSG